MADVRPARVKFNKDAKMNRKERASSKSLGADKGEVEKLQKLLQDPLEEHSKFYELPLSSRTLAGLSKSHFTDMTDVQQKSLPFSLASKDLLVAAKTGSGKTLAFLIPVIERLFIQKWSKRDGLGALIISPTRELAMQIFEVLRNIGLKHEFSAGLIIGGKSLKQEQASVGLMNILVATPGRLLQHMDQNSALDCSNLQILVLDEADRILDLGFSKTMSAILEFLPRQRQTLLFSATQTDDVKTLAALSLKNPMNISTYNSQDSKTPSLLQQSYFICKAERKLEHFYAFLKANLKSKIIVFVSSCKQVRFIFEAFCKLQPGITLLALHGKQKQHQRIDIYSDFCRKENAALICTDIASRGLDFPAVDWVLQLDCPEDIDSYVHRVGRTARFNAAGSALIFLLQGETGILDELKKKHNILINQIGKDNGIIRKNWGITTSLANLTSQNNEIKYLAQKAIISYIRSIYILRKKNNFDAADFPLSEFAKSFGLIQAPNISFNASSGEKNASRFNTADSSSDLDEVDFLKIVRKDHQVDSSDLNLPIDSKHTKPSKKRSLSRSSAVKIRFDDSDAEDYKEEAEEVDFISRESKRMAEVDKKDKGRIQIARKQLKLAKKSKSSRSTDE